MCVCVCVWLGSSRSFKHVSLNSTDTFCRYNLIKNPFEFHDKCLGFRFELVDEFTKNVSYSLIVFYFR